MSLTFPRKFTHGQKVGNVDTYGELFLWPDGHFQYMVHIRNRDPLRAGHINATFALYDDHQVLLGSYGMAPGQQLSVSAGQSYDELYGKVPEDKLKMTASVALLFQSHGQELDAAGVARLATTGSELVLCPIPG